MLIVTVFLFVLFLSTVEGKGNVFVIDGKKSNNVVSDEFLSFSIDLHSLLKSLNNSFSNVFAKHLSPSFIRIVDLNNELISLNNSDKWKLLHEWLNNNHLTPIFTINNKDAGYKLWDSKELSQFLDRNDDTRDFFHWQMLYGCDYKSPIKYKEDVMMLKYVLDMYSPSKVISGNLQSCKNTDTNLLANTIQDLEGIVDAYMWDFPHTKQDLVRKTPTWIAMPKANRFGFQSALQWFKRLGEAAKNSYNVVFWQGEFNIFGDTPIFWTSFLYKKLIGKTVLNLSTDAAIKPGVDVTAYCGKEEGAMVVAIANTANQAFSASIELANTHSSTVNVQKYILASPNNEFTFLNGQRLTTNMLKDFVEPNLESVEDSGVLQLTVPAQALGIFVLPEAKMSICGNNQHQIQEESELISRVGLNLKQFNFDVLKNTLDDLNNVQKKDQIRNEETSNEFRRFLVNKKNKPTKLEIVFVEQPLKDKLAQDHVRHIELQLTNDEVKRILMDRAKARAAENNIKTTDKQLEMQMSRAAKKMVKRHNADRQKIKRFAMNPKRRPNLKKRNKRSVVRRKTERIEKSRDRIADLAPVKIHGKNDESLEEEVLKSGERYLDERVQFLKGAGVNSELEDDAADYYHGFIIENYGNKHRIKRQSDGEILKQDTLGHRNLRPLLGSKMKHHSEIVGNRKKTDARLLKEKIDNRRKLSEWIRARRNKHTTRTRRSNEVYIPKAPKIELRTSYVSQVHTNKWKPEDLQFIKKEPSYSTEDLNEWELYPVLRTPRNTNIDENTIDEYILNKIQKNMLYESPTVTTTTERPDNFNNTIQSVVTTNDKIFFNHMVDSIRDFIETVYGNISKYFIG